MILGRLYCVEHPTYMCSCNPVICDGLTVHWPQEKCFSSNPLTCKLFKDPFLLTEETLPELLHHVAEHKNAGDTRTVIMGLGHLMNTFPLPFWLYDALVD